MTSGERQVAQIKLKNITSEGTIDLNTNTNFYNDGFGGMALGDSGGSIYYKDQLVGLPALHFFPVNGGGPRLDTHLALDFICPIIKTYKGDDDRMPTACLSN